MNYTTLVQTREQISEQMKEAEIQAQWNQISKELDL